MTTPPNASSNASTDATIASKSRKSRFERWRAHVINAYGGPTALMPFYATTADLAVTRLTDWLSLAHKQATGAGAP